MNCQYYKELISADRDGELSGDEKRQMENHLLQCDDCRQWQRAISEVGDNIQSLPEAVIPKETEEKIRQKTTVVASPKNQLLDSIRGHYRIPRTLAWAAVILLIVLAVNSLTSLISQDQDRQTTFEEIDTSPKYQKIVLSEADIVGIKSTPDNN